MRKPDEMEMAINLKAVKWAWFYTVLFLFTWTIHDYVKQGTLNAAFFLLISQNIIYLAISQFLKWKWGKDEK
ncbi:hypothetical protein MSSAC_1759 [Methanosarcina siciliae C2J]|uniref:Uncharacterized protein n=2 Tax=Methanosarcina siciliae TaxID=38027 RepID=A0A0E3PGL5_9EURY|nr:hypothetical protein [Methanosarcina siciliae]AKB33147.1 hypothetical protein MSSIH_2457 [Methanosarcina siciliae HI350]AKB36349.1 hypothetical protein MSSAC_1759 [Methanosarcina siciliae C2J]